MGTKDISLRRPIKVGTIPSGPGGGTIFGSGNCLAGSTITFIVTIYPSDSTLALWNFLYSLVVDSLTLDSNGQYGYLYPTGSLIPAGSPIYAMYTEQWADWATSSDKENIRVYFVRVHNPDTVAHTFYMYSKAYTWAVAPGGAS
jgi:hypothetical protein